MRHSEIEFVGDGQRAENAIVYVIPDSGRYGVRIPVAKVQFRSEQDARNLSALLEKAHAIEAVEMPAIKHNPATIADAYAAFTKVLDDAKRYQAILHQLTEEQS